MGLAIPVRIVQDRNPAQVLYHLVPSHSINEGGGIWNRAEYVICSSMVDDFLPITVFPANRNGRLTDSVPVDFESGSLRHAATMRDALYRLGYNAKPVGTPARPALYWDIGKP